MTAQRHLDWEGSWNARDLGGLPTTDGRRIRPGALVRSEHLVHLTPAGWRSLQGHGVRTLVDLRTTSEAHRDRQEPPADVDAVLVALEDGLDDDPEFARWTSTGLLGTPLYYAGFLRRWPDRSARAVAAVAHARPGGVLVHCSKGCDRTGMLVLLLLSLCGVPDEVIADDYALSAVRLRSPRARSLGRPDDAAGIRGVLEREGFASERDALLHVLEDLDAEQALRTGGLDDTDVTALRDRLLT